MFLTYRLNRIIRLNRRKGRTTMARTNPDTSHPNRSSSLDGKKVALVTGATSGIGRSAALKLLKKGG